VSTIKVDALQGTSGSDTAITLSGANATVGGTLAVTGVHTVGENAIYDTEGNGATQNLVQSLVKQWLRFNQDTPAINDSFNISSVTDDSTGNYIMIPSNNWANVNMCVTVSAQAEATNADSTSYFVVGGGTTTSSIFRRDVENNAARDMANTNSICAGELA
tara:strand:+ start:118 stop:600 length:483 start_codon:yes stop_codon:yes gene_type:complete